MTHKHKIPRLSYPGRASQSFSYYLRPDQAHAMMSRGDSRGFDHKHSPDWSKLGKLALVFMLILIPASVSGMMQRSIIVSPQASITFTEPDGADDVVGEGKDFATVELGDPWDMNQQTDLWLSRNMTNENFEDGVYYATTSPDNNSYFFLLWQGYPQAQNIGKTGQTHPIDASTYHRVSVALCSTSSGTMFFFWYYGVGTSNHKNSKATYVHEGCWIYVYDLHDPAVGDGQWTGSINGFRIDPKVNGGDIQVHWVRLTADPAASEGYSISWEGLSPSGGTNLLNLYADSNQTGENGWWIHTQVSPPASGSFQWGQSGLPGPFSGPFPLPEAPTPTDLEAGDYFLYATVNTDLAGYSAFPATISQMPQLRFMNPSYTSGPDFATEVRGNPWDMNGMDDIQGFRNITDYHFADGKLYLENTNWDPSIELAVGTPINTDRYRFLTIRSYLDRPSNVDDGTVARVFWYNDFSWVATAENIILFQGWHIYSLDLSQALLVPGSPLWTASHWVNFRIDPNENVTGETWQNSIVDDIKLTGPPEADGFFTIQWEIDNLEDEEVLLTLYYDTDNSGLDGIQIGQAGSTVGTNSTSQPARDASLSELEQYIYLPLVAHNACWGNCLVWNTSEIPSGEYFVYGCLDDGVNQVCRYSDVPVLVK